MRTIGEEFARLNGADKTSVEIGVHLDSSDGRLCCMSSALMLCEKSSQLLLFVLCALS